MIDNKSMDIKQNAIIKAMSDLELEEGVQRLNRVIYSNEWDKVTRKGLMTALDKFHNEVSNRIKNKTWSRGTN